MCPPGKFRPEKIPISADTSVAMKESGHKVTSTLIRLDIFVPKIAVSGWILMYIVCLVPVERS